MKPTMLRWGVVVGAAAVAAWFVLGWIQARDTGRAQDIVSTAKLTSSQAQSARSLLRTAGTLNPDRSVDLTLAQLAADQHDPARAVSILESVTGAEPLNLAAWLELSVIAAQSRRPLVAESALHHIHELLRQPK